MLEWLWPVECAGCDREGVGRVCPDCAGPGPLLADEPPEGIRGAWSLATYDGPLGNAVRRAKYGPNRHIAVALGNLLAERCAVLPSVDFVVPAPSTLRNRLARGFATSAVLAEPVARARGVPVRHALTLARGRKQAASTSRQRRANLVGRVHAVLPLTGDVLLVDDVVTTGATAAACARELLCAGASRVWLFTVCATRFEKDVQKL